MKKLLISLILTTMASMAGYACTNFIFSAGATTDGSVMITYAADWQNLYGELYFKQGAEHAEGSMRKIYAWPQGTYMGQIPQAERTYTRVGMMNEHQVAIGETTWFSTFPEMIDTNGVIDYGSLMFLVLERASSARQAIQLMDELCARYGYASEGETFSISDANEAWIMEVAGKGPGDKGIVWVARRVPDGYISGHANQARITTFPLDDPENCLYSPDVIDYAREKGYYEGDDENFSYADAYCPINEMSKRFCESRVWAMFRRASPEADRYVDFIMNKEGAERLPLWIKPERKLSVHDVMMLMRDHFEGTPLDMTQGVDAGPYGLPYRWRPLFWQLEGDTVNTYTWERATSTPQTAYSIIAQSRSSLPDPIGGLLWFGLDDTDLSVYMPVYCGITEVPYSVEQGNGSLKDFTWESGFWVFNWVSNFTYSRYSDIVKDVRAKQEELEKSFIMQTQAIEQQATKNYPTMPDETIRMLTNYSVQTVNATVDAWHNFGNELFVKYMDGYNRNKEGRATYQGYSDEWLQRVVKDRGQNIKLEGDDGH